MKTKLIEREPYSKTLRFLKDDGRIKIITGIRRSGKSSLLEIFRQELLDNGVKPEQIVNLNFELYQYESWTLDKLYEYLKKRSKQIDNRTLYIFLDEIQNKKGWEKVVNSLRIEINCDIYITGSNAYLNNNYFSTLLSGRTANLQILPFSFAEFLKVRNITFKKNETPFSNEKWILTNQNNEKLNLNQLFDYYLKFGGMPSLSDSNFNEERILIELSDFRNTLISRDIIQSRLLNNERAITNPFLLDQVFYFLLDNVGNLTSFNNITNTLISNNLLDQNEKNKPSNRTINAYVDALTEAFMLYEVNRFDLYGKKLLIRTNKYYSVDTGLRNFILHYPQNNRGFELENLVFLELKRRGYRIRIGKVNNKEIDFLAQKNTKNLFIQVTESLESSNVFQREIEPLKNLKEVGRKIIITGEINGSYRTYQDIEIIPIIDFLLDPKTEI